MTSLGEALPQEIKRVQALREQYLAIGPSGLIGATLMGMVLSDALNALSSGDLVEMIAAYQDLRGFEPEDDDE